MATSEDINMAVDSITAAAFGDIGGDRHRSTTELLRKAKALIAGKCCSGPIDT